MKGVCHGPYQYPHLFFQEIVEHAGRKEHRAAGGVDFVKPRCVIQVAGDVRFPISGGKQLIPHRDDIRKVQIVDFAVSVVAGAAGAVQPTAEVYHCCRGVRFQIIPHLVGKVVLPHGDLKEAEALHQIAGFFLQGGKIIVDRVYQPPHRLIPVQIGVQLGAHFPCVQRNDQRLLHRVLFNFIAHSHPPLSPHILKIPGPRRFLRIV